MVLLPELNTLYCLNLELLQITRYDVMMWFLGCLFLGSPASQTGEESQALACRATRQKHIWHEQWSRRNKSFSNQYSSCWYKKRVINLPAIPLNLWDYDKALLKLLVNSWASLHRPLSSPNNIYPRKPHNSRPRRPGFQGLQSPTFSNNAHHG